jgi:uncharacterized membrane protein
MWVMLPCQRIVYGMHACLSLSYYYSLYVSIYNVIVLLLIIYVFLYVLELKLQYYFLFMVSNILDYVHCRNHFRSFDSKSMNSTMGEGFNNKPRTLGSLLASSSSAQGS